jgi:hypothetical protein
LPHLGYIITTLATYIYGAFRAPLNTIQRSTPKGVSTPKIIFQQHDWNTPIRDRCTHAIAIINCGPANSPDTYFGMQIVKVWRGAVYYRLSTAGNIPHVTMKIDIEDIVRAEM